MMIQSLALACARFVLFLLLGASALATQACGNAGNGGSSSGGSGNAGSGNAGSGNGGSGNGGSGNGGSGGGSLSLFLTCGDPVCRGYTPQPGVPPCGTEQPTEVCRVEGAICDPQDDCNSLLVCATSDPRMAVGGCPISRRSYKTNVHYLEPEELARYQAELLALELATWHYKHDPSKQRLGFMLDDHETSIAADAARDQVDLYSYTSLAVAALQAQSRQIERLEREVADLKARLDGARVSP